MRQINTITCIRQFSLYTTSFSSRFLKPQTEIKRVRRIEGEMEKKIEKEIERIKRAKLRKKSLVDFYKITSLQREEFKTKIGLVLLKVEELRGLGMLITNLELNPDGTDLKINWSCKTVEQNMIQQISTTLSKKDMLIRDLIRNDVGELPSYNFTYDEKYVWEIEKDSLFEKIGEDLKSEDENKLLDQLKNIQLGDDSGGLSRDHLLSQVQLSKHKDAAQPSVDHQQIQQFETEYKTIVSHHGAQEKKVIKKNIAKFLAKRNSLK